MTPKKYRIVFFGTPDFAVPALQSLLDSDQFEVVAVVTQPDKPVGRKQVLSPSPIKELAISNQIEVLQPAKLKNNEEFLDKLTSLNADVNVVVAYGKILPQSVLDSAKRDSVNVHGSKLPKYRGASPITAAILNGDKEIQVTVQKMVFEMDEGPIIAFGPEIEITNEDTTGSLSQKLSQTVPQILPDALLGYVSGDIVVSPQNDAEASYVSLIKKEDGLIDWSLDENQIERMIRAYNPWPIAYTAWNGMNVKILEAEILDIDNPKGDVLVSEKRLLVGKLWIKKLQLPGKQPMSDRDVINGYSQFTTGKMI